MLSLRQSGVCDTPQLTHCLLGCEGAEGGVEAEEEVEEGRVRVSEAELGDRWQPRLAG